MKKILSRTVIVLGYTIAAVIFVIFAATLVKVLSTEPKDWTEVELVWIAGPIIGAILWKLITTAIFLIMVNLPKAP